MDTYSGECNNLTLPVKNPYVYDQACIILKEYELPEAVDREWA